MRVLYHLKFDYADPRLSQLSFAEDARSVLGNDRLYDDFEPDPPGKLSWEPQRLEELWSPPEVIGDLPSFCDFTTVDGIPLLSRRSIAALNDLLVPGTERLPCRTSAGEYFAVNILAVSEALDRERSDALFAPETGKETAFSVDRFEFRESEMGNHPVFRIREYPVMNIVDDRFVRRVEKAGLYGFDFAKIWPFAPHESWEDIELQRQRKRKREGVVGRLQAQSIEIRLPISEQPRDGDEPSEQECEAGGAIYDQLAAILMEQRSTEDDFIGAVEQFELGTEGIVIAIICPDSDRAFRVMEPALNAFQWPYPIRVELYPGHPLDHTVVPTILTIR